MKLRLVRNKDKATGKVTGEFREVKMGPKDRLLWVDTPHGLVQIFVSDLEGLYIGTYGCPAVTLSTSAATKVEMTKF
jgi:hypothetical protein